MKQLPDSKILVELIFATNKMLSFSESYDLAKAITEASAEIRPSDFNLAMERSAKMKREAETPEGRRYHLCTTVNYTLVPVIDAMPDSQMKKELVNMIILFLRMALVENDGAELSPSSLNRF